MTTITKIITLLSKAVIEIFANVVWIAVLIVGITKQNTDACIIMLVMPIFLSVVFKVLKGFFDEEKSPKLHNIFYLCFMIASIFVPFRTFEQISKN